MGKMLNLVGKRYGNLQVLNLFKMINRHSYWLCVCDCGNKYIVRGASLNCGKTTSCLACSHAKTNKANFKHGMVNSPEYQSWKGMLQRCNNKNAQFYNYYGGRGITACERWNDFRNFYADMGKRPSGTTLDRINSNGNYNKENCKWSTKEEQNSNRSNNHFVTFEGKTQTLMQWANEKKIKFETLRERLDKYCWPVEKALTVKVGR